MLYISIINYQWRAKNMQGIDLKILRLKAGLMQYKLAAKIDIPQSRLSQIENGKLRFDDRLRQQILYGIKQLKESGHS